MSSLAKRLLSLVGVLFCAAVKNALRRLLMVAPWGSQATA